MQPIPYTPLSPHTPTSAHTHTHTPTSAHTCRRDANGSIKDDLGAPWFYKESPEFYGWLRDTYMYHQLGQAALLTLWGGLPFLVWGFVIRVLFGMHMTWWVRRWGAECAGWVLAAVLWCAVETVEGLAGIVC